MATKTATTPKPPKGVSLTDYIGAAKEQLGDNTSIYDAETAAAKVKQDTLNKQADSTTDQISTVQKQYADLSKEFNISQANETGVATQQGNANIGSAEVSNAKSGLDQSAGGAFAAPIQQAQNDFKAKITDIATTYGAKQEQLTDTVTANVQELTQKAEQFKADGNAVMADLATTLATQKVQQQQQIISLASQMAAAQTAAEKESWKEYMDMVNAAHQQQTLDLTERRLAASESNQNARLQLDINKANKDAANAITFTRDKNGSLTFTNTDNKKPVTLSTYLSASTGSNDPRSVIAFLKQNGNATDVTKANDISNLIGKYTEKYGGVSMKQGYDPKINLASLPKSAQNQLIGELTKKYPEIFGDY